MVIHQFASMFKARSMEFIRDRGTFFWNLLFPVVLVFGFAFAFSGKDDTLFKIGVLGTNNSSLSFMQMEQAQFIVYGGEGFSAARSDAIRKLEGHQIDFIVDFNTQEFAINEKSTKGRLLRTLFLAQQATARQATTPIAFKEFTVSGNPIRYVDWLVPGVIGMNFMFSSLFGVGYVIVRYRKNGVLKRFKATPVHTLNFVAAQAASRLVIVLLTAIFVFTATNLILHFRMLGSYFNLLIVASLAILAMISLGLVFASRIRSEELAGGLINLVTLPMMGLSGIFFSLEGSPPILRTIARIFPLTHYTEAARAIMLDGAGLVQVMPNILALGAMTAVFLSLSALLFKWE